jgi:hypothetical protein
LKCKPIIKRGERGGYAAFRGEEKWITTQQQRCTANGKPLGFPINQHLLKHKQVVSQSSILVISDPAFEMLSQLSFNNP